MVIVERQVSKHVGAFGIDTYVPKAVCIVSGFARGRRKGILTLRNIMPAMSNSTWRVMVSLDAADQETE